jgi:hypothetical protein
MSLCLVIARFLFSSLADQFYLFLRLPSSFCLLQDVLIRYTRRFGNLRPEILQIRREYIDVLTKRPRAS